MPGQELIERPTTRTLLERSGEHRPVASEQTSLPRSLAEWLPYLWSRVLFPGTPTPSAWRWRPLLLLTMLGGVLLLPCLSFHLFEPDEGRYAQIPREMLERGDWIVPTLQGEPYLDKPPLFYWLVMGAYALFGYHDWAARLVPALAILGGAILTYCFGRRMVGERSAFLGGVTLLLLPGFAAMGRLLVLDGLLTFWVLLSLCGAWRAIEGPSLRRGWWMLTACACGLGVLTKGPIAVLLLVPPLWLYRRLSANQTVIGMRGWLLFAGIVLAVALPWYIAVCICLPDFIHHFLWEHNVLRFVQPFDHIRPVWFFVPILLAGMLPATLLAVPLFRYLVSGEREVARTRVPALGYLLLAAGWCFLFFSLSGCKLPTYILPAFPPLALVFGAFLAHSHWGRAKLTRVAMCIWIGLALITNYVTIPLVAQARSPMDHPERMTTYCGDPDVPVICFPRNVDSAAFYLGRSDFRSFRSKELAQLIEVLDRQPRTVVLFGHRNSLGTLRHHLPPHLRVIDTHKMGLCDMGVVVRID